MFNALANAFYPSDTSSAYGEKKEWRKVDRKSNTRTAYSNESDLSAGFYGFEQFAKNYGQDLGQVTAPDKKGPTLVGFDLGNESDEEDDDWVVLHGVPVIHKPEPNARPTKSVLKSSSPASVADTE